MNREETHTHSGLLLFIGLGGLIYSLFMIAVTIVRIIWYLLGLVINLCRLAAIALSPSPR
jgi:hypothetical protein